MAPLPPAIRSSCERPAPARRGPRAERRVRGAADWLTGAFCYIRNLLVAWDWGALEQGSVLGRREERRQGQREGMRLWRADGFSDGKLARLLCWFAEGGLVEETVGRE